MSLVSNERVKLTATWLNTLASATATVGVLAPAASILYGIGPILIGFWARSAYIYDRDASFAGSDSDRRTLLRSFVLPILIAVFGWAVAIRLGGRVVGSAGG